MSSNTFGKIFSITTFGESHGPAMGVVIDGCPAGIKLNEKDFIPELKRRRPGQSNITSSRSEEDSPAILSGVFEGKTTGMPIAVMVANLKQRPQDYQKIITYFRPGHADETYTGKYGIRDYRGGGRSSGRETIARVIGGVVARKILPSRTKITGYTKQIGPIEAKVFKPATIETNPVRCADPKIAVEMEKYILKLKKEYNSAGGLIEIRIKNPPAYLGDPVFKKLKAELAGAMMSVGAVTGFSYGAGFKAAQMEGLNYISDRKNFGGLLGGISTGEDIILSISIKPTTSVGEIAKKGRHDPCIVPRVIPVLEAMAAIVLADAYLLQKSYQ